MHHHQWYSRQQPLYRQRYSFTIGISLSNTRETRAAAEATQAGSSSCRDSERAFYLTLRSSSSRHTVGYGKFKKIICQTWSSEWFLATKTNFQLPNLIRTMTQIDSKSALEESQVCIAIAGLYINLTGLSWCYLKVTGPLWIKILIEKKFFLW